MKYLFFVLMITALGSQIHIGKAKEGKSQVGHSLEIQSKVLNETREVFVHLPADYKNSEQRYPVLYVLDGEWIFDFAVGAVEFLSCDISGQMPEMIVVGIPSTNRERDLYYQPEPFVKFIEEELFPYVESNYRTVPHRVLHGWSSGAAFSLRAFITNPELFNNYIASGAAISQRTYDAWKRELGEKSFRGKRLFANTEGNTPLRVEGLKRLTDLLETTSPQGLKWKCTIMEGEDHSAVLAKGLYAGLEFLYSDWTVPMDVATEGAEAVRNYYKQLGNEYGYDIKIPEGTISGVGFKLLYLHKNRVEEAIKLFKLNVAEHLESPHAYSDLGDAYEKNNQLELAKANYQLACKKAKEHSDRRLPAFEERLKSLQKKLTDQAK